MNDKHLAWEVRKASFPDLITFVSPTATESVSVTGDRCELKCAHCGGKYLRSMKPIDEFASKDLRSLKSMLLSGGCDRFGHVPLERYADVVSHLRGSLKVNCHSGLVDESQARCISSFSDVISFDFVCDDRVVSSIYGVRNASASDYIRSYISLANIAQVVPHICIGLTGDDGGVAEIDAVDALYDLANSGQVPIPSAIAFIIFIPTRGTRMERNPVPALESVETVLSHCRIKFPHSHINLGCMRPFGDYRNRVDRIAVDCGVNLIVRPGPDLAEYVRQKGLEVKNFDQCCAFHSMEREGVSIGR